MAAALPLGDTAAIGKVITAAAVIAGIGIDAALVIRLRAATEERTGSTRTTGFIRRAAFRLRREITASWKRCRAAAVHLRW